MDQRLSSAVVGLEAHCIPVSPKTTWIVLEVRLDNGLTGFGEATDFGNEAAILDEIARIDLALRESRPQLIAPVLQLLDGRQIPQARHIVRNALEQALLDAQGKLYSTPVVTLLGGPYRVSIPAYANINRGIADRSPEGFAEQAKRVVTQDGYKAIKIAPFDGYHWGETSGAGGRRLLADGVARILAVRDAIGPDVDLMADCHSRFDSISARIALSELEPAKLFWFEDPLDPCFPAEDRRDIRAHAHAQGVRIAGGEEIAGFAEMFAFLAASGTDVFLPDLRLTGIRQGMAMCQAASAMGQEISLHNPVGPVLDAVSRHVAAALPNFLTLERPVRETPLWNALRNGPAKIADGAVEVETLGAAGLGLMLDTGPLQRNRTAGPERVLSFKGMAGAGPDA